jgi:hypothetical protein
MKKIREYVIRLCLEFFNINIRNVIKHNELSNKANIHSRQTEVSDKL